MKEKRKKEKRRKETREYMDKNIKKNTWRRIYGFQTITPLCFYNERLNST